MLAAVGTHGGMANGKVTGGQRRQWGDGGERGVACTPVLQVAPLHITPDLTPALVEAKIASIHYVKSPGSHRFPPGHRVSQGIPLFPTSAGPLPLP